MKMTTKLLCTGVAVMVISINSFADVAQDAAQEASASPNFKVSCVRTLKNPTGDKVEACTDISQSFALECVAHWQDPNSDMIAACGEIASRDAADCVNALKSGSRDKISACADFNNSYASSCVKAWDKPSYDLIRSCSSVANPYALGCIDALSRGNSDNINACAHVSDQVGLDCVKQSKDKSPDRIRLCSIVDSLPNTNINCIHCTAEQQATNIKILNEQADAMKATHKKIQAEIHKALSDEGFLKENSNGLMEIVNCNSEVMSKYIEIVNYVANGNAVKKASPNYPNCTRILEKYDDYLSNKGR